VHSNLTYGGVIFGVSDGAVTLEESITLQRGLQKLMGPHPWGEWEPEVCISYATGTRRSIDAKGAGPGMRQAEAIIKGLHTKGISCGSGLHVPTGENWKSFLQKIRTCKVFIVLLSPAFYLSENCLDELYAALPVANTKERVIIPLLCSALAALPGKYEQWPDQIWKCPDDADPEKRAKVQKDLYPMGNRLPIGARCNFFKDEKSGLFADDKYLGDLIDAIKRAGGYLHKMPGPGLLIVPCA
jgi:hypothetical protein